MARFILKVLLYCFTTIAMLYGISFFAGPSTDPFYLRFTSPKQGSLVLGNSRAAQGIVPSVVNPIVGEGSDDYASLYNFSFTIGTSAYGQPYYKTLLRKLDVTGKRKSISILAVDPWSISTYNLDTTGKVAKFQEERSSPNNMHFLDISPNPEYLMKNLDNRASVIRSYFDPGPMKIMDDGSLAIEIKRSKAQFERQLRLKVRTYQGYARAHRFSPERFRYLQLTIDTLKKHGPVFLVRIPIHPEMLRVEQSFMPDFDKRMNQLSAEFNVPYLNHVHEGHTYEMTDGNHLTRQSAITFSESLAREIKAWLGKSANEKAVNYRQNKE